MAYASARKPQGPDVPHVDEEVNIHLGLVFQDVADKVAKPLRRESNPASLVTQVKQPAES